MIARNEANSTLDLGESIEGYLLLVGSNSVSFWVGLLLYEMMQSLIAWLNEYSWHQLFTIAQSWTAPVSLLGHSWPTFFLFLPIESFLFTLLWAEFFISFSVQNARGGGVSNFRVTLICILNVFFADPSFAIFSGLRWHDSWSRRHHGPFRLSDPHGLLCQRLHSLLYSRHQSTRHDESSHADGAGGPGGAVQFVEKLPLTAWTFTGRSRNRFTYWGILREKNVSFLTFLTYHDTMVVILPLLMAYQIC